MYLKGILLVAFCVISNLHASELGLHGKQLYQEPTSAVQFVMYYDFPGASSPVFTASDNTALLQVLARVSPMRQESSGRQSPNRPSSPVCGRRK